MPKYENMFGEDQNNKENDRGQKKPPGGFKLPPTTWVAWIAIIGSIVALMLLRDRMSTQVGNLSQYEFFQKFQSNLISQATVSFNPQTAPLTEITGSYYATDKDGKRVEVPFVVKDAYLTQAKQDQLFSSDKSDRIDASQPNTMLMSVVWSIAPFLLIGILFWFFFIRQIKIAGKGALSFGKSKARMLAKDRNKTTFKDVAGVEEAIEEVSELVEFLKDPKKFQRLGGRIP